MADRSRSSNSFEFEASDLCNDGTSTTSELAVADRSRSSDSFEFEASELGNEVTSTKNLSKLLFLFADVVLVAVGLLVVDELPVVEEVDVKDVVLVVVVGLLILDELAVVDVALVVEC